MRLRTIGVAIVLFAIAGSGASDRNQDAMAVGAVAAGMAGALEVVQKASDQAPEAEEHGPPMRKCCIECPPDKFACGNVCVPIDTRCSRPAGCACNNFRAERADLPSPPASPLQSTPPGEGPDAILEA
jgi:hypothetical protein